ncbi:MAG: hypoxanthine phosphoribosyltransferase [Bacteroidetes bacterium]|nr:MAG: hypoxanthine phosphoribosyltransferase [Bacteroidota bacterium]
MDSITLGDKSFIPYIPEAKILESIGQVAARINRDLEGKRPLFLVVLNGAFLFAADLLRHISLDCEVSFVKLASYHGTASSGAVKQLIGLNEQLKGRTVVIVEDIVDTGITLENIVDQLKAQEPGAIYTAALLFKPDAYKKNLPVDYVGMEIPNAFIVGYGLDYNGLGRNLRNIYVVRPEQTASGN